jgi:threonine dehydrogenase-like Zn-dependent dehydrogenase
MRGVVMYAPGDVRVENVDEPQIQNPTDAIIRLSATCICGSVLWPYRGADDVTEHAAHVPQKFQRLVTESACRASGLT